MSAPVILQERHSAVIRNTWIAIFLLLAVDFVWIWHAKMSLAGYRTAFIIAGASALFSMLSYVYNNVRKDAAIWLASQVMSQMVLGSCAIATFNYLGLRLNMPLIDRQLMAFDEALGFNWPVYIGWVEKHPAVAQALTLSYITTEPVVLLLLVLLCFSKRFVYFHRFAQCFLMGGFITVAISIAWPAVAEYIARSTDAAAYPHLQVASAVAYKGDFYGLRNHTLNALPENFQGLVTFPSFHSMLAVLAIWGAAALPSRLIATPIIAVNLLMLFSTPVDGGHYLVDTLAGIAIGIAVVALSARLVPEDTHHFELGEL